jgi:hypothetical protein
MGQLYLGERTSVRARLGAALKAGSGSDSTVVARQAANLSILLSNGDGKLDLAAISYGVAIPPGNGGALSSHR